MRRFEIEYQIIGARNDFYKNHTLFEIEVYKASAKGKMQIHNRK